VTENILLIRLGALGDLFLCLKPFQDIRRAFPAAKITVLTTSPFAGFVRSIPFADAVMEDRRRPLWDIPYLSELGNRLRAGGFTRVFDFQHKKRTALYRHLFLPQAASAPRVMPSEKIHRQQEYIAQIRAVGVPDSGALDMDWMQGDITSLALPARYAALIPGCSPHLLHKRWPPSHYAALAQHFKAQGLDVLLIGTKADAEAIAAIQKEAPFTRDLSGKTDLAQLASVLRGAETVVGNDTGPTFLAAMIGAPTLTLMSHHTDPVLSGPLGPRCGCIKRETIAEIAVAEVVQKIAAI
jgi:ADP-heptose:LPS heptosyltransferase